MYQEAAEFIRSRTPQTIEIGMILGTVSCYLLGTIWLGYQAGISFAAALTAGVLPFIPGDLAKMVFSIFLGYHIRKRLRTAHLISS